MSNKDVAKLIFEQTGMVLLYLTVALLGASIAIGLLLYFFKREKFNSFKKALIGVGVGYSVAVVVVMMFLKFTYNSYDTDLEHNLIEMYLVKPILSMVLIAVIGVILTLIVSLFHKKAAKAMGLIAFVGEIAAFIATIVFMQRYFNESANTSWYPSLNTTGLIASTVVIIALLIVIFLVGKRHKNENNTKALVFGAISIALSFALSYIKMFEMPQGGSVTLASLLPLMVYCCMFGTRRGLVVCIVYGVLQALQDPWIIHPLQFLLDYPLAFGLVGVSGIFMEYGVFKKHKIVSFVLGAMLAVLLRYACHVCSGVFAFADTFFGDMELTAQYTSAITYSLSYNSFAFIDMLIAMVAGGILFASKAFTSQLGMAGTVSVASVEYSAAEDDEDDIMPLIFGKDNGASENTEVYEDSSAKLDSTEKTLGTIGDSEDSNA